MATTKVAMQSPGLQMDAAVQALQVTHSPDRKRKQRTPESPDRDVNETLGSRSLNTTLNPLPIVHMKHAIRPLIHPIPHLQTVQPVTTVPAVEEEVGKRL
jgi:hypothetical protein